MPETPDTTLDCPACEVSHASSTALRRHKCAKLGRELTFDEWTIAISIELIKREMLLAKDEIERRQLRDELAVKLEEFKQLAGEGASA